MKLIACDMDGTLLNNNHEISSFNEETIKKIKNYNKFVIASGRPYSGIKRFIDQLGINDKSNYSITYNGSVVVSNFDGEIIFKKTIPGSLVREAYKVSSSLNIGFLCYDEEGNFVFDGRNTVGTLLEQNIIKPYIKISDFKEVDEEYIKLIFADSKENIDKVQEQITSLFNKEYNVLRSHDCFLEIVSKEANKGVALNFLSSYLNIKKEDIYAFGDNDNDYPLLMEAKNSYVMSNSPSSKLRNSFTMCSSNEEDGVGLKLKEIFKL